MYNLWNHIHESLEESAQGEVFRNESMADHTSWKTGGTVRALVKPGSREAFVATHRMLLREQIPFTVVGAGSNILWADPPYAGIVLKLDLAFSELSFEPEGTIRVGAGVRLRKLLTEVHKRDLGGFSFLYGIPGTVGGAVRMNAGTRNGEMKDILVAAEVLSPEKTTWKSREALELAYRSTKLSKDEIVINALLRPLGPLTSEELELLKEDKKYRKSTQPLQYPSGGSVFRNPEGGAAGALIDGAGLKGRRVGGAQVSDLHANFIINSGESSSSDILKLIREVQAEVFRIHEVWLEPEVRIMGPWSSEATL